MGNHSSSAFKVSVSPLGDGCAVKTGGTNLILGKSWFLWQSVYFLSQFASQLLSFDVFSAWAGFVLHPFSTVYREAVSLHAYFNLIKWIYFQVDYP